MRRAWWLVPLLLTELEWIIVHPLLAGLTLGVGWGLGAMGRGGPGRWRRQPAARHVGDATAPAPARSDEVGSAETPAPDAGERSTRGMVTGRWPKADVGDLDTRGTWLYIGVLSALGVVMFLLRLPLRSRSLSLWRLSIEVAGNVAMNTAVVWTMRWARLYRRRYGDDRERFGQDATAWLERVTQGRSRPTPEAEGRR